MQDQQITTIILAGREMGGMGNDYFENKTRHLLPIANKPLIQQLIETLDNCKSVDEKYILLDEKAGLEEREKPSEEFYNLIFGKRIGDDIILIGQDPLTQVGTFAAVKGYMDKIKKVKADEDIFPLLVLYGDTLIEEKFLNRVIDTYKTARNSEKEEKSRIIWGLIETEKDKSNVYCTNQKHSEKEEGFFVISGDCIFDCFQHPKMYNPYNYLYLYNTGIMVISKGAWENIRKLIDRIHRPSPHGLFTFENIIKQALIFKNIQGIQDMDIEIVGIVAPKDQWYGANYPWEILELNKTKISDLVKDAPWTGKEEKGIGEKTIFVPKEVKSENGKSKKVEFTLPNGARINGPCILGKGIEIQDYAVIENSYIGDGCSIESHASIHDSTLVKDITIHHHATIERSIIMDHSDIYYHAEILHSIIGKNVMIGGDVKTPCQRLKNVDGEPKSQPVTYFLDIGIKKTERFGAIIGDYCQIGSGTVIHPGRRVGKRSKIYANCEILKNIKPYSRVRNKDVTEIEVHG